MTRTGGPRRRAAHTGKQLIGRLKALWSARVGNYRVLYTVETGTVIVRAIRHRLPASPPLIELGRLTAGMARGPRGHPWLEPPVAAVLAEG